MSSRLQRLGARLLGSAPTLAPRLATRFEPTPETNLAADLTTENRFISPGPAMRPGPASRGPATPLTAATAPQGDPRIPSPSIGTPSSAAETAVRGAPPPPVPTAPHPAPNQPPRQVDHPTENSTSAPAPNPPPTAPQAEKIIERVLPAETTRPPAERSADANPESTAVSKRHLASEIKRLREWISRREPAKSATTAPPRPAKASARDLRSVPNRRIVREPPSIRPVVVPLPQPPRIEISIGTIIVRATTPEHHSARPDAPANPAAGLGHYLARRSAGIP